MVCLSVVFVGDGLVWMQVICSMASYTRAVWCSLLIASPRTFVAGLGVS